MLAHRALLAFTGIAVLMVPMNVSAQNVSAQKEQAVSISGGGATELGKATLSGNPSIKDLKVTVNVSEASALLSWMQQIYRRENVEKGSIVIRLENDQKFEFVEPMITDVDLSGAQTVTIKIKHRDGMLRLTAPKGAWNGSWPPVKKK
jgi:hypothetical protein